MLVTFAAVLLLHLLAMMFFNHIVPNAKSLEIRGPFAAGNYLRPALVFALPTIVFLAGITFAVGALTRRPVLVFVLPVVLILACGFFLWQWAPTWLDPHTDRVLMLLDPAGYRWLSRTWLKVDRGVDFYNHAAIPFDNAFLVSRLVFVLLGLASVGLSQWQLARVLRGSKRTTLGWIGRLVKRRPPAPHQGAPHAEREGYTRSLAELGMSCLLPGLLHGIGLVARVELRAVAAPSRAFTCSCPSSSCKRWATTWWRWARFGTPLLLTSGTLAVGSMNTLTLLVCLLLLFYMVESLQRERHTSLASIYYATPVRSASMLFGKVLANSLVGVAILFGAAIGCIIAASHPGSGGLRGLALSADLGPAADHDLPRLDLLRDSRLLRDAQHRCTTYAVCLGVLIFTGYRQYTGKMNWVGNWNLWDVLRLERHGPAGNGPHRSAAQPASGPGADGLLHGPGGSLLPAARPGRRLHPETTAAVVPSSRARCALLPFALTPLALGIALYLQVDEGFQGEAAKKRQKDYWRHNLATWKDTPRPALTAVDIDVELDPDAHWFHATGTYDLLNHLDKDFAQVALTGGDHWENVSWTQDGQDYAAGQSLPSLRVHSAPASGSR